MVRILRAYLDMRVHRKLLRDSLSMSSLQEIKRVAWDHQALHKMLHMPGAGNNALRTKPNGNHWLHPVSRTGGPVLLKQLKHFK